MFTKELVWETVPTDYCFILRVHEGAVVGDSSYRLLLHFFSPLEVWVFFLQSLISQLALWVSGTRK